MLQKFSGERHRMVRDAIFRRTSDVAREDLSLLPDALRFQVTLLPRFVPAHRLMLEVAGQFIAHPARASATAEILDAFGWRWRFAPPVLRRDLFVRELWRVTRADPAAFGATVKSLNRRLWLSPRSVGRIVAEFRGHDPRLHEVPTGWFYGDGWARFLRRAFGTRAGEESTRHSCEELFTAAAA